jgi:indolepyruvate ferredoxin oxidoreductase beta subunit
MKSAEQTVRKDDSTSVNARPRAISIAILAMGGEGGGVLADWIVDLAEHSGYCAQTTSVPGVAQRTGATIYYVEIFPDAAVRSFGKEPVLALMPVPGEVDIVIASELMEAGRAVQRGLVTPQRTTFIASTHRVYSMTEKMAAGDGRVDAESLAEGCQKAAKIAMLRDFARIASEKRSVISAVLFGALAGTKALPFSASQFEAAIRRGGVGVESSLSAFAAGLAAANDKSKDNTGDTFQALTTSTRPGPQLEKASARVREQFPARCREILFAGIVRLADYQDPGYADTYLNRLEAIRDADQRFGDGGFLLLRECARFLALWMSYEDAIRVADLKIRSTRFARVQQDSQRSGEQVLQIHEFLYPQVQEIADILPRAVGAWLLRVSRGSRLAAKLTARGRTVQTTSLRGFLQLRLLAGMRRWRRSSLRFSEEERQMADWLERVRECAQQDYALACGVAEFPQLLRGYGETQARGRDNFAAMMAALPQLRQRADASVRVTRLRDAALADESGQRLRAMLEEVCA